MRFLSYKLFISAALLAVFAGCHCSKAPVATNLQVSFVSPTNNQNLTAANNSEPGVAGFHFNVVAQASDSGGAAVSITSAKLETLLSGSNTWTAVGPVGVINGAQVTFANTPLQPNANQLRVTVGDAANRTASQTVSVTVGVQTGTVTITSPASGATLNASNNAATDAGTGFQLAFAVSTTGLNGDTGILICPDVCGIPPTNFTVGGNGKAAFNVTLTEGSCEQISASCTAVVTDSANHQISSAPVTFTLDTIPPEVVVSSPAGSAVSSLTFEVQAVVSCAEDGSSATLSRTGGTQLSTTVQSGLVTFPTVTVPTSGNYDFTLSVTDKGGNVTNVDLPLAVEPNSPTVTVTVTSAVNGVVTTDSDSNAANGVQAQVVVTADSEPVGTEVDLWTTVSGTLAQPRRAPTATVGADRQTTFTVDLAEGANTIKVCVTSAAGLQTCKLQAVTVNTGRPVCRILSPADSSTGKVAALTVAIEAVAGAVRVDAFDSGGTSRANASGTSTGSGQLPLTLTLPANGAYHLIATCTGGGVSQNLPLTLDTAAPMVTVAVRGDTSGTGDLGPSVVDTSPQPGMQVILDVTTKPYAAVAAILSGTGCPASSASGTADGNGTVAMRDFTVPGSGTCLVTVNATDLAGNTGSGTENLTLAFSAGSVSITDPAPGSILTGPSDGGTGGGTVVPVTLSFTAPVGAGTLSLTVNGGTATSLSVTPGDTSKTFANVQLAEGSNVLRAVLTDASGATTCVVGIVYVNTQGAGAITLVLPASGSLIIADDFDANTPGIQSRLQYTAQPKTGTSSVDVCTSVPVGATSTPCRDGSGGFTLASNVPALNSSFTFPDGAYSLWVVLDDSGAITASSKVNLVVDSVRPKVITAVVPADTNGDGILSLKELQALDGGAVTVVVTAQNLDNNGTASVVDATTGTVYGPAVVSNGSGTVTVPLTQRPSSDEASYSLLVNLVRSSGNPNKTINPTPLDPLNAAAFIGVKVDNNNPVVAITAPTKAVLGIADVDAGTSNQILVAALITDTDIPTNGVTITAPAGVSPPSVQLTPSGGQVSQSFTLSQGATAQQYTFNVSATDNAGNIGSAAASVTAILCRPTITISQPMTGTVYTSHNLPMAVTVAGCSPLSAPFSVVTVTDQIGTGTVTTLGTMVVQANGTASGTFNVPNATNHTIGFSVTDAAGNAGSASVGPVNVTAPGCDIQLTKPATTPVYFGRADDLDPVAPGLQYQVKGIAPDLVCHGLTVTLCAGATCTGSNTLNTQTTDPVTGAFTFATQTFADPSTNQQFTVMMNNGVVSSDTVTYSVKLSPPVLSNLNPAQTTLFYVSPSNIHLLNGPSTPGYIADLAPGNPTFGTADFSFQVGNAEGGTATLTYGATVLGTTNIPTSPDPFTVTFTGVHLPQQSSGTLSFAATDLANNQTSSTANVVKVDVVPPAASTFTGGLSDGGFIQDPRTATLSLNWTASGDDGTTGTPAGYDLRWSTGTVLAGGITNDAEYFNPAQAVQATGALLPAATSLPYALGALPPLNTYSLMVRAVDSVGNYPPYQQSNVLSVANLWTQVSVSNLGAGSPYYGYHLAAADLDGNGADELIAGSARDATGKVYLYYGGSSFPGAPQVLLPPDSSVQQFGWDFSVGNVGDAAAENLPDLLVGAFAWSANRGRAFLYFGKAGVQLNPNYNPDPACNTPTLDYVEFRGTSGQTGQFGASAQIVTDGTGLGDIMISAESEGTGKVYLFYGRTKAQWMALRTLDASDNTCVISTAKADHVFDAESTSIFFGRRRGYAAGDFNGDGVRDYTIPSSHENNNKVYVHSGAAVQVATGDILASSALQILHQGTDTPCGASENSCLHGFGEEAFATNLVGSNAVDLVVGQSVADSVWIFPDATSSGFTNAPRTITSPFGNLFGFNLAHADLNGDGKQDVAIGQNNATNSSGWVFFNAGTPGAEFDLTAGAGFHQARLSDAFSLGLGVAVGDFNGDGKKDLAFGNGTNSPGQVLVWY